uniref:Alpha/beta hydrolase n=1 Tax=Drosophila-associated filamentous virus TaxID=2743186 RepID=A0A6M9U005_9VIRU|nr:putative protein 69 [Drosophila-associated filamentous virus]
MLYKKKETGPPILIMIIFWILIWVVYMLFLVFVGETIECDDELKMHNITYEKSYIDKILKHDRDNIKVLPHAMKEIIFFKDTDVKTEKSVVYLHGWQGSKSEAYSIITQYAKNISANVYFNRYPGNGQINVETAHDDISIYDYLRETYEAYSIGKYLGNRVIICCSSTGCLYAFWLLRYLLKNETNHAIDQIICMSPNFKIERIPDFFMYTIMSMPIGKRILNGLHNKIKIDKFVIYKNSLFALISIMNIIHKKEIDLDNIPIIIFSCKNDPLISHVAVLNFYQKHSENYKQVIHMHQCMESEKIHPIQQHKKYIDDYMIKEMTAFNSREQMRKFVSF